MYINATAPVDHDNDDGVMTTMMMMMKVTGDVDRKVAAIISDDHDVIGVIIDVIRHYRLFCAC